MYPDETPNQAILRVASTRGKQWLTRCSMPWTRHKDSLKRISLFGEHPMSSSSKPSRIRSFGGSHARGSLTASASRGTSRHSSSATDGRRGARRVRWIGCSNELDAAYAADGYARVRCGCSDADVPRTPSASCPRLNGVMGARAERSCVFHLVGMPDDAQGSGSARSSTTRSATGSSRTSPTSSATRRRRVSAVITPDNCTCSRDGAA